MSPVLRSAPTILPVQSVEATGALRHRAATDNDDRVEGYLTSDATPEQRPFSGWAELMSLLEPPSVVVTDAPRSVVGEDWF